MKPAGHLLFVLIALGLALLQSRRIGVRADDLILEDDDDDDQGTNADSGCPVPRKGLSSGTPQISTTYGCPSNDGKIYETSSGQYMYIQCCTDRTFGRNIGGASVLNLGECMDLCMKEETGTCRSVTWDSSGGNRADAINCVMWAHGGFSTDESRPGSHHAFLVEAPYVDQPDDEIDLCSTQCPGANHQVFTTQYGESFLMICGKRHGTAGQSQYVDSYEQCMSGCGMLVQCKSVDYHPRTGRCTFGDHGGEPTVDAPGYMSAYSMGCSGACKEYPKTPPAIDSHCPAPGDYHAAYWAIDNKAWQSRCSMWQYTGSSYTLNDGPISVENCMKKCQDDAACKWGTYLFATGKCLGYVNSWITTSGVDGQVKDYVNFAPVPPPF
ncbi:hypothetical protein BDV25DRAFT_140399 [Aspergillus avenaceus]|uniref:Apple domain-containing protein n=1 Tax=Aspergillus avenaceus TaxID=36643 RepID=A0A5N6TUX3_ASPAV|nr:hypothetical protein BDV25DRAFT_140399 [Aspergillus avenaceus]